MSAKDDATGRFKSQIYEAYLLNLVKSYRESATYDNAC